MLRNITIAIVAIMTIFSFEAYAQDQLVEKVELKTKMDTVAYIIGSGLGEQLKNDGLEINAEVMTYGLKVGMSGEKLLFDKQQVQTIMTAFQTEMQTKKQEKMMAETANNKAAAEKFLAENKDKPGVVTLDNGCQYKILKSGTGRSPKATDEVKVHYHGTFMDGKVFDSSVDRGEPIKFPLDGVIKGWTETIPLMQVGDKWIIYIPSDMGYGPNGNQGIPGNSLLIFEVELLEVISKTIDPNIKLSK